MFHLDPRSKREINDLINDIQDMPGDIEHDVRDRWIDTTRDMARDAASLAPQRTGTLKRSIDSGIDGLGSPSVFAGTDYAVIQNYGGYHPVYGMPNVQVFQSGHHFMDRALERVDDQIMQDASDAVSEAGRKAGFL